MELHALDRKHAVAEAHDEAVRGVGCDLQTLRQGLPLQDQAVITAYGHGLREPREEAAPVMVNSGLVTMHRFGAHDASAEVLTDRLVPKADPEDGELSRCEPETLHRGGRGAGLSWARPQDEPCGLQGLDRGPICAIRAHHTDLRAQLQKELGEVEGEGVSVVEDYDHCAQDAQRAPLRKSKAKKPLSEGSRLARAHSWNKVPG